MKTIDLSGLYNQMMTIFAGNKIWMLDKSLWSFQKSLMRLAMLKSGSIDPKSFVDAKENAPWTQERIFFERLEIIPISGVMVKGVDPEMAWWFDLADMDGINYQVQRATDESEVGGIVLKYDSPGGMAQGCAESFEIISECAKQKPILAYSDSIEASAAFYGASAASERSCAWDAIIGGIGTYQINFDMSRMLASAGIDVTEITTAKMKTAGDETLPLTEEKEEYLQGLVNQLGNRFVSDVSKSMEIAEENIRAADGRCYIGEKIIEHKYADRIETFSQAKNRFSEFCSDNKRSFIMPDKKIEKTDKSGEANIQAAVKFAQDTAFNGAGLTETMTQAIINMEGPESHVKDGVFDIKSYADSLGAKIADFQDHIAKRVSAEVEKIETVETDEPTASIGFIVPVCESVDTPAEGFGCLYFNAGVLMQRIGDEVKPVGAIAKAEPEKQKEEPSAAVLGFGTKNQKVDTKAGYSQDEIRKLRAAR
jgi:signal peptide peptidase SppA